MNEPPREAQPIPLAPLHHESGADYVAEDLPCQQCGHNLRTLGFAGVCTECGTPVEYSLRGYLLRHVDIGWVRRVARGCVLLIVGLSLLVIGTVVMAIWGIAEAMSTGYTRGAMPAMDLMQMTQTSIVFYAPITVLVVLALSWITTREPNNVPGMDSPARAWLRRSLWLYVASWLFGLVLFFTPARWMSFSTQGVLMALNAPIGMAIFTLMSVLAMRYFAQLMARVPRPGLVQFANVCFWGLLICGSLMTLGSLLSIGMNAQTMAALRAGTPLPTTTIAPPGTGLPPNLATFGVGMVATGCGGCVGFGFDVAAFVLLIMVCSALFGVVRTARPDVA